MASTWEVVVLWLVLNFLLILVPLFLFAWFIIDTFVSVWRVYRLLRVQGLLRVPSYYKIKFRMPFGRRLVGYWECMRDGQRFGVVVTKRILGWRLDVRISLVNESETKSHEGDLKP